MKTTTRFVAMLAAAAAVSVPFVTSADAAQQLPPRCSIEPSGLNSVKGSCPSGFYWVTVKCKDVRWADHQARHQWGDAKVRAEMVSSCKPWQFRTGGEVFNATTGEKVTITL